MIHLERTPEVDKLSRAAFPAYKGRTFKLDNSGAPVSVTSYWDGGSRNYYTMVDLATMRTKPVPQNGTPFDGGPIAPKGVTVPPGYVIAEHSIFCGKDHGVTFYVNPDTAIAFLPAQEELTATEKIVLTYTASLKNTYGGMTNIRFRRAHEEHGTTQADWTNASDALKSRKLLTKAGAITTAGRNAASITY
jgi:hypothetical protein